MPGELEFQLRQHGVEIRKDWTFVFERCRALRQKLDEFTMEANLTDDALSRVLSQFVKKVSINRKEMDRLLEGCRKLPVSSASS